MTDLWNRDARRVHAGFLQPRAFSGTCDQSVRGSKGAARRQFGVDEPRHDDRGGGLIEREQPRDSPESLGQTIREGCWTKVNQLTDLLVALPRPTDALRIKQGGASRDMEPRQALPRSSAQHTPSVLGLGGDLNGRAQRARDAVRLVWPRHRSPHEVAHPVKADVRPIQERTRPGAAYPRLRRGSSATTSQRFMPTQRGARIAGSVDSGTHIRNRGKGGDCLAFTIEI